MHPLLFTLGPFTVYSYGALMVVAFLAATLLSIRAARRLPPALVAIRPDQLIDFTCIALLGGILGARVFYAVLHWESFVLSLQELLAIWHGGLVWYGGFLGGVLAGWGYLLANRIPFVRAMDQCIPFLALGHAIGRVGCFFNGCCYGRPTTAWCGVIFPGHATAVLPIQLFEAAGLLGLYALLRALQRPVVLRRPGIVFGVYLGIYALLRFFLEWFRGDQVAWWAGLTLQQLISVGVLLMAVLLLSRALLRMPRIEMNMS